MTFGLDRFISNSKPIDIKYSKNSKNNLKRRKNNEKDVSTPFTVEEMIKRKLIETKKEVQHCVAMLRESKDNYERLDSVVTIAIRHKYFVAVGMAAFLLKTTWLVPSAENVGRKALDDSYKKEIGKWGKRSFR